MTTDKIVIFTNDSDNINIDAKLDNETLWLTLNQLSNLFDRDKSVISRHLKKIFIEDELDQIKSN